MNTPILIATDISMHFGGLKAVEAFNLRIQKGELVGLIGPNGAGKTTVFNVLTGIYSPTRGSLSFCDINCLPLKPFEIARLGLTRTFQNIRLFKEITVLDNVLISLRRFAEHNLLDSVLATPRHFRGELALRKQALELLAFFNLENLHDHQAGSLPYGAQRKLEIVRALATKPKLILLDEPAAGMNNKETEELEHLIVRLRREFDLTVLLIEHDMKLVMGVCERILVLDHGVLISEGTPSQVKNDPKVVTAYLGVDHG